MAFNPWKRNVPPNITLEEKVARDKWSFPMNGTGWDIKFIIFFSNTSLEGHLLASDIRHVVGLPGTFLVYWEGRFRGVINWTKDRWDMGKQHDPDLVFALGEWIQLYYG